MQPLILDFDRNSPVTTGRYLARAADALGIDALAPSPSHPADPSASLVKIDDSRWWSSDDEPLLAHPNRAFWAIDTHTAFDRVLEIARRFSVVFAAQRDGVEALRNQGVPAQHLPLAAEPDGCHRDRAVVRDLDVAFVGRVAHPERAKLLRLVEARFDSVALDSSQDPERIGALYSRARVVVNHAIANDVNMRLFEAASAGGVPVTSALPPAQWEGIDLMRVEYAIPADALACIQRVLDDPELESRIRDHNRTAIRTGHTYVHRLRTILEALPSENEKRQEKES